MTDEKPKTWTVLLAATLDFGLVFFGGGYVIAALTGGLTDDGFSLSGGSALLLFALIAAYFIGMKRLGGTIFKRIFGLVGKVD